MVKNKDFEKEDDFIIEAIRPPRKTSLERLIASELALAMVSEPMVKIRHIYEAYLLVVSDRESLEVLGLDDTEHIIIKRMYKVLTVLSNPIYTQDRKAVRLPWNFNIYESWKYLYFIYPFFADFRFIAYEDEVNGVFAALEKEIKKVVDYAVEKAPDNDVAFKNRDKKDVIRSGVWNYYLSIAPKNYLLGINTKSYKIFVTKFISYNMDRAVKLMRLLFMHFVDPATFDIYLQFFGGGHAKETKTEPG